MLLVWIAAAWIAIFIAAYLYDRDVKERKRKADEEKQKSSLVDNNEKTEHSNDQK